MRALPVSSFLAERKRRALRTLLSIVSFIFAVATSTAAREPGQDVRVLLISETPADPIFVRVVAELAAQGFAVTTRPLAPAESPPDLLELATRESADAAVAIHIAGGKVHISIVDRVHDQALSASLGAGESTESARAIAALRTVELVRTNLLDLLALTPREPAPRRGEPQASREPLDVREKPITAPADGGAARWAFGPAVSLSPPGSEVSWHALFAFRISLAPELGFETLALAPLTSATFAGSEGSVDLWFVFASAGFGWESKLWHDSVLSLAAGAGGLVVRTVGHPDPGYRGHDAYGLALSPYLRLGFAQALARHFGLRADLMAATALPRTVLMFDGRRAGVWGQPWLTLCAGTEWQAW